jgi:hypothetical protein
VNLLRSLDHLDSYSRTRLDCRNSGGRSTANGRKQTDSRWQALRLPSRARLHQPPPLGRPRLGRPTKPPPSSTPPRLAFRTSPSCAAVTYEGATSRLSGGVASVRPEPIPLARMRLVPLGRWAGSRVPSNSLRTSALSPRRLPAGIRGVPDAPAGKPSMWTFVAPRCSVAYMAALPAALKSFLDGRRAPESGVTASGRSHGLPSLFRR